MNQITELDCNKTSSLVLRGNLDAERPLGFHGATIIFIKHNNGALPVACFLGTQDLTEQVGPTADISRRPPRTLLRKHHTLTRKFVIIYIVIWLTFLKTTNTLVITPLYLQSFEIMNKVWFMLFMCEILRRWVYFRVVVCKISEGFTHRDLEQTMCVLKFVVKMFFFYRYG